MMLTKTYYLNWMTAVEKDMSNK